MTDELTITTDDVEELRSSANQTASDDGVETIPIENASVTITDNTTDKQWRCRACGHTYEDPRVHCTHCIATNSVATVSLLTK